jgi:hypothetical protein
MMTTRVQLHGWILFKLQRDKTFLGGPHGWEIDQLRRVAATPRVIYLYIIVDKHEQRVYFLGPFRTGIRLSMIKQVMVISAATILDIVLITPDTQRCVFVRGWIFFSPLARQPSILFEIEAQSGPTLNAGSFPLFRRRYTVFGWIFRYSASSLTVRIGPVCGDVRFVAYPGS